MAAGAAEPYGREGLPLDEARRRVLSAITPLNQSVTVPLNEALGRVSAEAVLATDPVPGFRASIMDGYAPVSYTHLRAHETRFYLVCRLLLEKNFFNDTATTEIYTP